MNGLTVADKVYIMTKFQSPAEEHQCIARAARTGNQNKVHVMKYHTTRSIENRTRVIQDEKIAKAQNFLDPSKVSDRHLMELRKWSSPEPR